MVLITLLTLAALYGTSSSASPHILMLMIDDLGYSDHGLYTNSVGTTPDFDLPHFEALAGEGVLLEGHYVQPVCSPTRTAFQTGRYPFRIGTQHATTIIPASTVHMPRDIPTLPEVLKSKGYVTAMIGKWHCGYSIYGDTPYGRGFDSHVGYFQGQTDYYNKTLGKTKGEVKVIGFDFWFNSTTYSDAAGTYSLIQYMDEATRVLETYSEAHPTATAQEAEPLFLFFSHQTVHLPIESLNNNAVDPRCNNVTKPERKVYCSMLVEMDDTIKVLRSLYTQSNLWENTLVLASTDNGGMVAFQQPFPGSVGSNFPLRGSKTTLFEGGVRGTGFLSGGALPARMRGTTYKGLSHIVDFTETIATAAGVSFPNAALTDGIDLIAAAQGGRNRTVVPINVNSNGTNFTAIRFDNWKLIVGTGLSVNIPADGWWKDGEYPAAEAPPAHKGSIYLFDVETDFTEHFDVSAQHPDIVARGLAYIQQFMAGGYEPPQPNEPHPKGLPNANKGVWAPFLDTPACLDAVKAHCQDKRGQGLSCRACLDGVGVGEACDLRARFEYCDH